MSIEINDSIKSSKNKTKNHIKPTHSNVNIVRMKNKINGNENKGTNSQSNLNILIPSKKFSRQLSKSKNILENSLKVKKYIIDKKEKEEEEKVKEKEKENEKENKSKADYHKIPFISQKNNNHRNSNKDLSPKSKKKSNLNVKKNPNENDILKLVTFANKVYEDEEHFKKDIFTKRDKYDSSNPNTKRNMYHHKRSINNEITYKISKELLPESGNKNIHFRRRLSSATKLRFSIDFSKSKEKSNYSNLLKLKQNLSKENEDDTKYIFDTQENNNKIKNCKFNNYDLDTKHISSQKLLIRAKTLKHSKSKEFNYHKKIKEEKEEETINKSINKNKLSKVNTLKSNNTKNNYNKSQIQDLEIIKKESSKKFKKYRKNYYCFLCCLNSKNDDSDNED